jgi:SPP1 family predicted phage head-tail adaptor
VFDDGVLTICQKVVTDENRGVLDQTPLEKIGTAFYGEISFTANEYYAARQAETLVEKRVQIHQNKSICNKHVIIIDGVQYDVGRTFSTEKKGVALTEITLERVNTLYDIANT